MNWNKGLLIYNGKAGQKNLDKTLGICVTTLSPHIKQLILMPTQEPKDAVEICRQYGEEVDIVIILGGDGTVHECVNGLAHLKNKPVVGILPSGTCNDFSRELGMSQNIRRAAEELLMGNTKEIDVGKVDQRYFLNFWGIGLIANTSTNINPIEKNTLGKISYFLSAIRTLNETDSFSFKVQYDEQVIEDEAIMILISNGGYVGTNRLPFKGINSSDGLLDVIIVKNSNLAVFKEVLLNKKYEVPHEQTDRDVIYFQAKSVNVSTTQERIADTDGELYMHTPAKISLLPAHLTFLCGENQR